MGSRQKKAGSPHIGLVCGTLFRNNDGEQDKNERQKDFAATGKPGGAIRRGGIGRRKRRVRMWAL